MTQPNYTKYVNFFKSNYPAVRNEVERWFSGTYSPTATRNGCVAHQVSCLKLCQLPHPKLGTLGSLNVDHFVDWALKNKWKDIEDVTKLLPGDICVSGPKYNDIDHIYCFVRYIDKDTAYVLHNQAFGLSKRSLAGVGCGKFRFALRMP